MSGVLPAGLLAAVQRLVEDTPPTAIAAIAKSLAEAEPGRWGLIRLRIQGVAGGPSGRVAVDRLLKHWQAAPSPLPPIAIAAALEAAAEASAAARARQSLELVWTGPSSALPLRHTAQALRQVIDEAQTTLLIVSYAVYDIPEIGAALRRALDRGVTLQLVIESPKEQAGHVAYDGLLAFGDSIRDRARVYRWPSSQRPVDDSGHHGALHVKCAVADNRVLLLSSANLTRYALSMNMEIGILIHEERLPSQVMHHFTALIEAGVLLHVTGWPVTRDCTR